MSNVEYAVKFKIYIFFNVAQFDDTKNLMMITWRHDIGLHYPVGLASPLCGTSLPSLWDYPPLSA